MRTPSETALVQAFEAAKAQSSGRRGIARVQAFEIFNRNGLPHRRVEEFKYTDLRAPDARGRALRGHAIGDRVCQGVGGGKRVRRRRRSSGCCRQRPLRPRGSEVRCRCPKASRSYRWPKRSPPDHRWLPPQPGGPRERQSGLPAQHLLHGRRRDDPRRRRAPVEKPVHLRFVTASNSAVATATRVLVVVEDGASVTLLESHEGSDGAAHQLNDVIELIAGDRRQGQPRATERARATRRSRFRRLAVRLGGDGLFQQHQRGVRRGRVAPSGFRCVLDGENSKAQINGVTMIKARQHADTTLIVEHAAPALRKPRAVQDRHRRRRDGRVPGQDHRARPMPRRRTAA